MIANALIESFCIHARQLIDFFENRQGVRAREYVGGTYAARHTCSLPRELRKKLDEQVAHISKNRFDAAKIDGSDREHFHRVILQEASHFAAMLAGVAPKAT